MNWMVLIGQLVLFLPVVMPEQTLELQQLILMEIDRIGVQQILEHMKYNIVVGMDLLAHHGAPLQTGSRILHQHLIPAM